ncbi:hypothetical protein PQ469_12180 [Mucilaginibacter sp. KACC 22773]|nr:hypothetical protein [Mucilaginibacter sp. KACC 22773]WDF80765.1 hypothetical protein PQ469_12180 [Mucilaginibacter sp. KACC 22773]
MYDHVVFDAVHFEAIQPGKKQAGTHPDYFRANQVAGPPDIQEAVSGNQD